MTPRTASDAASIAASTRAGTSALRSIAPGSGSDRSRAERARALGSMPASARRKDELLNMVVVLLGWRFGRVRWEAVSRRQGVSGR